MKAEVFPKKSSKGNKGWYYHLKSSNGRILCVSESYTQRTDAIKAVKKLVSDIKKASKIKLECTGLKSTVLEFEKPQVQEQ